MMALRHLLWSVAVIAGVTCTQVSVNRHFRGDIFSLEGEDQSFKVKNSGHVRTEQAPYTFCDSDRVEGPN